MEMNKFDACTFTTLREKTFFLAVSKLSRDAMHDVSNMVFAIYDAERPGFKKLKVLLKRFNEKDGALNMSHHHNHNLRNILIFWKLQPP